jgi:hypothetical protein
MDEMYIAGFIFVGGTIVEMVMLVIIFRKAGFNWFFAAMAFTPILGTVLQSTLIYLGTMTPAEIGVITHPLSFVPLLVLAFKSWPIAALPDTSPETFK